MTHNCWTPGRIVEAIARGWVVPADWRERLERAGYVVPTNVVETRAGEADG